MLAHSFLSLEFSLQEFVYFVLLIFRKFTDATEEIQSRVGRIRGTQHLIQPLFYRNICYVPGIYEFAFKGKLSPSGGARGLSPAGGGRGVVDLCGFALFLNANWYKINGDKWDKLGLNGIWWDKLL